MSRLVALVGILVLVDGAASATPNAARPRALLTYTASPRSSPDAQFRVCIARSDGKHPVRIVSGNLSASAASWSPNGSLVAFTGWDLPADFRSGDKNDIVVADARGRLIRNMTPNNAEDNYNPKWSPDGRWIAFFSSVLTLSLVPSDGSSNPTALALSDPGGDVAWFPDGKRLAISMFSKTDELGIYSVNLDGTGLRFLVQGSEPSVSPDGSQLAYTRIVGRGFDIYVAKSDGSKPHQLAKTVLPEGNPSWSPDGKWIAFERTINPESFHPRNEIVVARSNGKGAYVAVTAKNYDPFYPTWRRGVLLPKAQRPSC